MEDNFEELYAKIRKQYDEMVYKDNVSPMSVFGIYLGIIAQEFRDNSSKEEFENFLSKMIKIEWNREAKHLN